MIFDPCGIYFRNALTSPSFKTDPRACPWACSGGRGRRGVPLSSLAAGVPLSSHLSGGPLRGLAPLALVASRFFLPAIFFAQFNALWPVRPVPHRFETVFLCVLYNCMQILFNLWCLREARSPVSILRLRLLSHARQNQEIPEMRSLIENLSNANHL